MPEITEGNNLGDLLKQEREFCQSREAITVLSGQVLAMGAVFGLVTKVQAAAPIPGWAGTGNGVMSALVPGPDVQTGIYVLTCTEAAANGGTFSVTAPDGSILPYAEVGTAYSSSHLDLLISDGSTDFIVGDSFAVVVTAGETPVVVGDGNGVVSAVTLGPLAQNGTYKATCVTASANGGTFAVTAPDGTSLGNATVGTAFANEQVNFSVADGATDFSVGDYFNIVVAAGSGKAKPISFTAVDGTQNPAGFALAAYDATDADVEGVGVVRDVIIVPGYLTWPTGTTTGQKASALAAMKNLGIITATEA